jgi:hypothetical protein
MIKAGDLALGKKLIQVDGVRLGNISFGKALAKALTEIGIALYDENSAGSLGAFQQFGSDRPGPGAQFEDASGPSEIDAANYPLSHPTGTGHKGGYPSAML